MKVRSFIFAIASVALLSVTAQASTTFKFDVEEAFSGQDTSGFEILFARIAFETEIIFGDSIALDVGTIPASSDIFSSSFNNPFVDPVTGFEGGLLPPTPIGDVNEFFITVTLGSGTNTSSLSLGLFSTPPRFIDSNIDGTIVNVSAIPEPATWLMMIMGFAMVGLQLRRRNRQSFNLA